MSGQSADGGEKDFHAIALPYLNDVARFALSLTRDQTEADDLVQETFLNAFRGWHTFQEATDCRRWLITVCHHAFVRSRSRTVRWVESDEGDVDSMPTALDHTMVVRLGLGDLFDRIDVRPAIERAVAALPEPHHSILAMVDIEGHSYEEAAQVLRIPIGTVRSRLYRARRMVQQALVHHAQDMGLATHSGAIDRSPRPVGER